ncbi:type IV toxin-antitoxin system AbiEi family antitoxin domain-containing protein [Kribbella soli]|uniref:type IV toxin-antitoxin system AbiEi family antitoxin domain-containing protein n=1 Tax=Kribbella soli TaxID=1124743 RepID=UPI0013F48604|nr:type IV toxin-antitoxin system AbiEi family antitoxin domain-containing protein [Kribbella soli]
MEREFEEVLRRQLGAFSRAQANAAGMSDRSLAARCRAGRIQRLYRGAYVHFSGPVPWETRLWAAWLAYGPEAALADETALRQYGIYRGESDVIRLEIPHRRRLRAEAGVAITRTRDFAHRVLESREPPMVRLEVAVLTVASRRARPDDAAALVLDACRQRRTTPQRLLAELARMQQLPGHGLLVQIVSDPCGAAVQVATVLRARSWPGLPTACGPECPIGLGNAANLD